MESDTSRTNEEAWTPVDFDEPVVFAAFARQLERELAAMREQRDLALGLYRALLDGIKEAAGPREKEGGGA